MLLQTIVLSALLVLCSCLQTLLSVLLCTVALRFPAMPGKFGSARTSEMHVSLSEGLLSRLVSYAQGLRMEWPAAKSAL